MSAEPFDVTDGGLARLFNELGSAGAATPGSCLTDDEAIDYATDAVSEERIPEVNAHLRSCPTCCERLLDMIEAAGPWLEPDVGEARLQQLSQKLEKTWSSPVRQPSAGALAVSGPLDRGPRVASHPGSTVSKRSRRSFIYAAAAAAVVAGLGTLFFQNRHAQPDLIQRRADRAARQPAEQERPPLSPTLPADAGRVTTSKPGGDRAHQPLESAVIAITLIPGLSRNAGETQTVVLPRAAKWLVLNLSLERDDHPQGYSATVQTAGGGIVARAAVKSRLAARGQRSVALRLAAEPIETDDYVVDLAGMNADGTPEAVASYTFRVTRSPR
jgi:hypothetical protein